MMTIKTETICKAIRELDYQCQILASQHEGREEIMQHFKCNADALREIGAEAERLEKREEKLAAFEKWLHENPKAVGPCREVLDRVELDAEMREALGF